MDASEFNERVKLLQRAMGDRQRRDVRRLQLLIGVLAAGLVGTSALLQSWMILIGGAFALGSLAFTLTLVLKLMRPSGAKGGRALDVTSADLETAIASEDGTVSYICEKAVVVGPRREVLAFSGKSCSVSFDEDKRALKVQIQDELDDRDRRGLLQSKVYVPLPSAWSERHALRVVKRWSVWIAEGPDAGRKISIPPLAPVDGVASNG